MKIEKADGVCSLDAASVVKEEMDIGPAEFNRVDVPCDPLAAKCETVGEQITDKMEKNLTFNLANRNDQDEIARLLIEKDENVCENFSDDSDTDGEDHVELRSEDSETEQEISDQEEDIRYNVSDFYIGEDKISRWRKIQYEVRRRRAAEDILLHLPGVKGPATDAKGAYSAWNCLIDDSILEEIVTHTNQYIVSRKVPLSCECDAALTDKIEMKAFIGLLYLAGIHRGNRQNIEDLWDANGDGIEKFRLTMNLRRFRFLMRTLRFDDRETRDERKRQDNIAAIRAVFEAFVKNCQKCYSLGENVTVDEMLPAFRGRCRFRQHIPSKPSKYGIKVFSLVDSKLHYTYDLEIYAGRQPDGPYNVSNKPVDVVNRIVKSIANTGRNITADNWFSDINLVEDLSRQKLSFVGTLKKNKPQIPREFQINRSRAAHSSRFGFQEHVTLVSYIPKKGKNVFLVSSLHNDAAIDPSIGDQQTPEILTFYNSTKGAVDVVDQMCGSYSVARNCRRWPMVIFFLMMNIAGINSQIIYLGNQQSVKSRRQYLKGLSNELIQEHLQRRSVVCKGTPVNLQLNLQKFRPTSTDEELEEPSRRDKRRRCSTCYALPSKKTRLTKYACHSCGTHLCLEHCINLCKECHSLQNH